MNPILHVEIPASDLDRAITFYQRWLQVAVDEPVVLHDCRMAYLPFSDEAAGASIALVLGADYRPSEQGRASTSASMTWMRAWGEHCKRAPSCASDPPMRATGAWPRSATAKATALRCRRALLCRAETTLGCCWPSRSSSAEHGLGPTGRGARALQPVIDGRVQSRVVR